VGRKSGSPTRTRTDNLLHFAGGMYYSGVGSFAQTTLRDIPELVKARRELERTGRRFWLKLATREELDIAWNAVWEKEAEIVANRLAGQAYGVVIRELRKGAPWYMPASISNRAWLGTWREPGSQWRKGFCK